MRGRKILIPLPNSGALAKRKQLLCIRIAIAIFIITFIVIQIVVINSDFRDEAVEPTGSNDSLALVPQVFHKFLKPKNISQANGNQTLSNEKYQQLNISEIQRSIERYNDYQTIINEEIFGPLSNDSVIIVVQVHKRITYLRHLIVSLAQSRDIARILLVFSHDFYDEEINELVQSIDFCKVMQIFYPYSIQTHPNEFPGEDPKDCPRDMKKEQALIKNCQNAQYPDLYGHYREAKFSQTKHHWWWKANRVFDQLEVTRYHTGLVLFLEEDHYVAEDFIYMLDMMQKKSFELCAKCNIMSLGTYLKTFNYYTYNNNLQKVEITPWISSKHNMGMAFNKTTWHDIKMCAKHFCSYDDYNWDWSLQQLSHLCMKNKLFAMVVRGPRVFHIGECGVHHKKKNCESNQVITKVQQVINVATKSNQLYPKSLMLTAASVIKKQKIRKGNGGWGDKRDHLLCLNMTLGVR